MSNPFRDALRDVFSPVTSTLTYPNSTVVSASGEGVISYNPAWCHGITYTISANNTAIDWRLVNASATAVGAPILFNVKTLPLGADTIQFPKPMNFDKGLMWVTSASGTCVPQIHVHWEPGPNPTRGN